MNAEAYTQMNAAATQVAELAATLADLTRRLARFEDIDPAEIAAYEQRRDAILNDIETDQP